ncbi:aldehyde dehydrogenase family protein [Oligoflexus tunisiensis]|uniref:aldehyde dehydrogenase family protein n=1 Tax=Oligoflexus tunisiensis TaxID=708132 RepID=UPI000AC36E58|nr:aldehyde dehydrogenase family protein [Oligoflexus tunisiensis]
MGLIGTVNSTVRSFLSQPHRLWIDGQWVAAASGQSFPVENPANGDTISQVAKGDAADIDRAVRAARAAFEGPWSQLSASARGRLLWRLADLIDQNADELAQLESLDNGKPITVARAGDVPLAADIFRYMAGWSTKISGKTFPISVPYTPGAEYFAYTTKEAVGVVGQIIPWNFPLLMAAWKLAPALAAGCTVVLKPAEQTPLSALRLGQLIQDAGFPSGVVNIVTGFGEAGAHLAQHPGVDKVAFTGSTEVGRLIVAAAAGNLKKVTLELGGKSPNIIFDDADLDVAIPGAANAIFFNHGQCCCAGSRLYIHDKVYDKVLAGITQIAQTIQLGEGLDPKTQMGPLVSREQLDRVCSYVRSGVESGARVVVGGRSLEKAGYFMQPTILTETRPDMKVVREEIFGPVMTAMRFTDTEDLLRQANDTEYGLAAGLWTRDVRKAHQVSARLRAGTTWINCYNIFDAALPFGGYKQSGWGREMGEDAVNLYLETKSVCLLK